MLKNRFVHGGAGIRLPTPLSSSTSSSPLCSEAFETIDEPESLVKSNSDHDSVSCSGRGDCKGPKWKKLSSKDLGINNSMIAKPTRVVLNGLKRKGFEVYLVGGCVRDLILKRTPKDFDIITSAELKEVIQVMRTFSRCDIVGRRFPICHVHIEDTIVEVRTMTCASLSFVEDCARILRAIRIAARLGFRLTRETAQAIRNLSGSVLRLDKSLFSNMDKLLAPDRPCHSSLWVGILAFHKALLDQPRDPLVVAAFCLSVHNGGDVLEALNIAKRISTPPHDTSFHELLQPQNLDFEALIDEVMNLAASVKSIMTNMTDEYFVLKAMSMYNKAPYSDLVAGNAGRFHVFCERSVVDSSVSLTSPLRVHFCNANCPSCKAHWLKHKVDRSSLAS
ncbi:tRNA nucleotidyltransferase/polyA polymerase family protein [Actinidia rufa]|uniref:tRNA nucleotidyltransferase/polyA polymerase family protein n=1 Tax=Actinidia rufa TaxID=165716 RepID=A0A7J0GBG0_9ERIC|nr:tRNA nucleotidyltransferase/polyA polymerase family protein [Actinidia rufa]